MNHAGSSPCPDDSCPDARPCGTGFECRSVQCAGEAGTTGPHRRESLIGPEPTWNLPIQNARADAAIARDSLPFVVQAGPILFMVAEESSQWVVAELRFDAVSCTFAEERRAQYQWPREAFGRLLSRTSIGDEIDHVEVSRVSEAFSRWLASQFVM